MLIRNRNWKQPTQGKMEMAPMTSTAQFNLRQQLKEELSPLSDAKIIRKIESWKRIQKANSAWLSPERIDAMDSRVYRSCRKFTDYQITD